MGLPTANAPPRLTGDAVAGPRISFDRHRVRAENTRKRGLALRAGCARSGHSASNSTWRNGLHGALPLDAWTAMMGWRACIVTMYARA